MNKILPHYRKAFSRNTLLLLTALSLLVCISSSVGCVTGNHHTIAKDIALAIYTEDRTHASARTLKIILDHDGGLSVAENVGPDFVPERSITLPLKTYQRLASKVNSPAMNRLFRIKGGVVSQAQKNSSVTYRIERTISGKHERISTTHRMAPELAPLVQELVRLATKP